VAGERPGCAAEMQNQQRLLAKETHGALRVHGSTRSCRWGDGERISAALGGMMLRGNRSRPAVMCWVFCGLPTVVGSRSHHSSPFIHTSGDEGLVLGRVGAGMAESSSRGGKDLT